MYTPGGQGLLLARFSQSLRIRRVRPVRDAEMLLLAQVELESLLEACRQTQRYPCFDRVVLFRMPGTLA